MKYWGKSVPKQFLAIITFFLLILGTASCGGEGSEGGSTEPDTSISNDIDPGAELPVTIPDDPVIIVPSTQFGSVDRTVIGGTGLKILSPLDGESPVSDGDGFSTSVSNEGTQLLLAVDSNGELRGLTLSIIPIGQTAENVDNITPEILPLDASSTALGVLFMVPGMLSVDLALTQVRVSALQQLTCFDPFVSFLQNNLPTRSLNDLVTEGTLQDHVFTCANEWRAIVSARPTNVQSRLPSTGPVFKGSDNPAKFVLGITDKSEPSAVGISYFHGGYRSIHVFRADFFPENITTVPMITDLGRMIGVRSFTLGSLFTGTLGDPPTPKTDIVDFQAPNGSIASQYWVIGPGFVSGNDDVLTNLQPYIDDVENRLWLHTVWEYLVKPLLGPFAPRLDLIQVVADAEAGFSIASDIATIKRAQDSRARIAALGGLGKNVLDIVIEEWSPQSAQLLARKASIKAVLAVAGQIVAGVNATMFMSELSTMPRTSMFEIENIKPEIEIVSPEQDELIVSETGLVSLNANYFPVNETSLSDVDWMENDYSLVSTYLEAEYNFSEGPHELALVVVDRDGAENTDNVSFYVVRSIEMSPGSTVLDIEEEPVQMIITDGLGNPLPQDQFQWSVENVDTTACDFTGTGQVISVSNGPISTTGTPAGYVSPVSIGLATVIATHVNSGLVARASIEVEGPCPDINIRQGSSTISHSQNTIQYDFGEVQVGESSASVTFTIENLGLAYLDLGSVMSNNVEFVLTDPALTTIPPNQSTTFPVIFEPANVGVIQASITILSNDENESPFFFLLQGTGYENTPPSAGFTISAFTGNTDTVFQVDASNSMDQEDTINQLQFRWNWTDTASPVWDGIPFSSSPTASHTYDSAGSYRVWLQVRDSDGLTSIYSVAIEVSQSWTYLGELCPGCSSAAGIVISTLDAETYSVYFSAGYLSGGQDGLPASGSFSYRATAADFEGSYQCSVNNNGIPEYYDYISTSWWTNDITYSVGASTATSTLTSYNVITGSGPCVPPGDTLVYDTGTLKLVP